MFTEAMVLIVFIYCVCAGCYGEDGLLFWEKEHFCKGSGEVTFYPLDQMEVWNFARFR